MKYKVYEAETIQFKSGKGELKKLVLQSEAQQYPMKNVTMWSDHPLYETVAPGQEIDVEVETKDSDRENPKGGFYKDRTVMKPGQVPEQGVQQMRTDTNVAQRLDAVVASLKRIEDHLGCTPEKKELYPADPNVEEITEADVPF